MTIREMHIGIELALQELNSNLYNTLQVEEKDYLLNRTIEDFVRAVLTKEENTIRNIISYADIRKYYEMINPFIKDIPIGFTNYQSEGYIEGFIPGDNLIGNVVVQTGMLYEGVTYLIVNAGTTNLINFGYKDSGSQVTGEKFTCSILEIDASTVPHTVYRGEKYRIINNPTGYNFRDIGSITNEPGEEFIVTAEATIDGGGDTVIIKPLIQLPTWEPSLNTELKALDSIGMFEFISSESFTQCGLPITSGELTKDKYYVVNRNGTTDLRKYGAYGSEFNDSGVVFKCTSTGTPNWDGITKLYKVCKVPNRLIKYQDKSSFLNHSYGTVQSSPVSTIINNKLRVYHDSKFNINSLFLQYLKVPTHVDYLNEIDCDLPSSLHGKVIDWTVMRIMGTTGNPAYQVNKDFEITNSQTAK